MTSIRQVFMLVAVLAFTLATVMSVSAGTITGLEVNGVQTVGNNVNIGTFTGDVLPVKVNFVSTSDSSDVRIKAWISGDSGLPVSTERFDVIAGSTYNRLVYLPLPSYILDNNETLILNVLVEGKDDGQLASKTASIRIQRESYELGLLDVNSDNQVKAGDNLLLDIVLKNVGSHFAEDAFVKVSIPALGVEQRAYFGDLTPVDQGDNGVHPVGYNTAERQMALRIPSGSPAGIYEVKVEAFNSDSLVTASKKIAVVSSNVDSQVVSSSMSKTFAVGQSQDYNLLLVNSGNKVKVYNLVFDTPTELSVSVDDSVVAIPAGSSKSVKMTVTAAKAGTYHFGVKVISDGEVVDNETFTANVTGSKVFAGNATVVLTVVLAIVFVVLLVVLIVLLTRKPEKTEEFGESYY